MQSVATLQSLQETPLFSGLNREQLEVVSRKAKVRQYFAGDVIVWQGQPSTALFIITNGIVAVKSVSHGKENILAYLMPGNTFGEVGILENQARSASVAAVSEVDVIVLQRDDFLDILNSYAGVAIELARILGRYLVQSSRRLSQQETETRLILVITTEPQTGGTTFSAYLAYQILQEQKLSTAYLEYPNPWRLLKGQTLPRTQTVHHHNAGFDVLFPQEESYLPLTTRTTLLLDKIRGNYEALVVHVEGELDDATLPLVEQAAQIILISPPSRQGLRVQDAIQRQLKNRIRPDETSVLTIVNSTSPGINPDDYLEVADFVIPYIPHFASFSLDIQDFQPPPEALALVIEGCMRRLERTNSIGIFIPTTTDTDQKYDTQPIMDKTLNFMAERFGGATCKIANGVWNSEKIGLIGEVVYIVHSYITRVDLNRYLDEVIDYIKSLKRELRQEAMALEINNKLTLI
ncbi:MAG: cyclic nucleotide-binding domain-containing protein [Bacteroidia bacterium]|nr:cyclic nucleotide-binding domain-containing protein [Bacteroidia bacterium]